MPQSNGQVSGFDLVSDMNNYYRGCIVTYSKTNPKTQELVRYPAYVDRFTGDTGEVKAAIRILKPDSSDWSSVVTVPQESLDLLLPPLGMVKSGNDWFFLNRAPARRMRKGYSEDTIAWSPLEGHSNGPQEGVTSLGIIKQLWFGTEERVTSNVVVWGKGIYYATDLVATVDDNGLVNLIQHKEKLGELVCKALANNWESVTSKHSVRTLPSSLTTG